MSNSGLGSTDDCSFMIEHATCQASFRMAGWDILCFIYFFWGEDGNMIRTQLDSRGRLSGKWQRFSSASVIASLVERRLRPVQP